MTGTVPARNQIQLEIRRHASVVVAVGQAWEVRLWVTRSFAWVAEEADVERWTVQCQDGAWSPRWESKGRRGSQGVEEERPRVPVPW